MTPCRSKKLLLTTCGQKIFAKPEKSGTTWPVSHCWPVMCVCVCVCVCESERWRTTLWWCAVEVSAKKHTYLSLSSNTYLTEIQQNGIYTCISYSHSPVIITTLYMLQYCQSNAKNNPNKCQFRKLIKNYTSNSTFPWAEHHRNQLAVPIRPGPKVPRIRMVVIPTLTPHVLEINHSMTTRNRVPIEIFHHVL